MCDMSNPDATRDMLRPSQVSQKIGVSARTIQRHEDALREVGAMKTSAGWRIPADQVDNLASLVTATRTATPRQRTNAARRTTTDDGARHCDIATHEACRATENALRLELADAKLENARQAATITELRTQIADLVSTKDKLLDQQAQATAANAAMALSLREGLQRIEHRPREAETATPETNTAPHHVGAGLRTRLARLFS